MSPAAPQPERRRPPRRWVVPPALLFADRPYQTPHVLEEVREEPLAGILWQAHRDVELWAQAPEDARARLFAPGSAKARSKALAELPADHPVRGPVVALSKLLTGTPPAEADVTRACQAIATWASEGGRLRTALLFSQAAALSSPEDASASYEVGRAARRRADYGTAETWYRRAVGVGRRKEDWKWYGLAFIGLANLHIQRGNYPAARSHLVRALRTARRYALWYVRAEALHDLFRVTATAGRAGEAEVYARRAFRAYGRRHPRVVALAHDVAYSWLLQGHFERALPVFQAVVGHIPRASERTLVVSSIARAAGGSGNVGTFSQAWDEVWSALETREETELLAASLVNLAHGAATLGDVGRAETAARHTIEIATDRNESEHRIAAEAILASLRGAGVPQPTPRPQESPESDALAAAFVQVLTTSAPAR